MPDMQQIRTDLKDHLLAEMARGPGETFEGWRVYDYVSGAAELPSVTVSMPERVEFTASLRLASVFVPLVVVVGSRYSAASEAGLLAAVTQVGWMASTCKTAAVRSARIDTLDEPLHVTVGNTKGSSMRAVMEVTSPAQYLLG